MLITGLEEYGKKKKKVYIDGEYVFWLYQSEIYVHDIKKDSVITEDKLSSIYKEILIRVKKYALSVLERMDRTEYELYSKLKQAGYTDTLIEEAVRYVKKYSYINDYQYTLNYIRIHMSAKSKRYILNKLNQKGIDKQMVQDAFFQLEEEIKETDELSPEIIALKKEISKKVKDISEMTIKDKQKLFSSLCRKGFEYDMIKKELSFIDIQLY